MESMLCLNVMLPSPGQWVPSQPSPLLEATNSSFLPEGWHSSVEGTKLLLCCAKWLKCIPGSTAKQCLRFEGLGTHLSSCSGIWGSLGTMEVEEQWSCCCVGCCEQGVRFYKSWDGALFSLLPQLCPAACCLEAGVALCKTWAQTRARCSGTCLARRNPHAGGCEMLGLTPGKSCHYTD